MQVQSVDNTNFKALKNVKISGKHFRKNPNKASEILKLVKYNEEFQNFCKRWDVNAELRTIDYDCNFFTSNLNFSYKPCICKEDSAIKKFFRSVFRRSKTISVSGSGHSFVESADDLCKYITVYRTLDGQIKYANEMADNSIAKAVKRKFVINAEKERINGEKKQLDILIREMTDK